METRSAFSWLVLAALLTAAPAADAVMYRWIEEDGSVKYADKPPEDRTAVRELTTIVPPKAPAPEPPKQALPQQQPVIAAPEPAPRPEQPVRATPGTATPRVISEAVQDPCLRSSDPKCIERNKDRYHPYLGYAPTSGGVPRAVGATSSSAGGTVGGGSGSMPALGASVLEPRKTEPARAPTPNR